MLHAIHVTQCPALECESSTGVRPIYESEHPEVYRLLQEQSRGYSYDYYHCKGWCKRLWRIRRIDTGQPYEEPQCVGAWDDDVANPTVHIYETPRAVSLEYTYRRSLSDPLRPARNKTDATRRAR